MKFREQYDEEAQRELSDATAIGYTGESMTEQHHAEDADINIIMKRYGVSDGAIPPQALDPSYYANLDDAVDLRTTLDLARDAQARFDALPVNIRKQFDHSPAALYHFVSNPANAERSVEMGLLHSNAPFVRQAAEIQATEQAPTPAQTTP